MHAIISNMSDCITCWGQAEETVIKQWIHVYRDWIEFLSALNPNHIEAHVSHTFLALIKIQVYLHIPVLCQYMK